MNTVIIAERVAIRVRNAAIYVIISIICIKWSVFGYGPKDPLCKVQN